MWINQWHKWRIEMLSLVDECVAPIEIFGYLLPHFPTTHIAHACVYIRHVMTLCKQTVSGTVTRGHKWIILRQLAMVVVYIIVECLLDQLHVQCEGVMVNFVVERASSPLHTQQ